jgi:tripartite-type tricarboxylate transporter receptor subunit TctC
VERLNREIVKVMASPEVEEGFSGKASTSCARRPAQMTARVKSETALWSKIIKDAGIKAE